MVGTDHFSELRENDVLTTTLCVCRGRTYSLVEFILQAYRVKTGHRL
jgi:hypothetical protein